MKVLFLDIDGVLNSARSCIAFGGYPLDLTAADLPTFDLIAVAMIRNLCRAADLKVVLSSAWRKTHSFESIGRAFGLPLIDRTPSHPDGVRGGEIKAWLDDHPEVTAYAIVDDDGDMLPEQAPRFVQTSGFNGISFDDIAKLARLFDMSVDAIAPSRNIRHRLPTQQLEWMDGS